MNIINVGYSSTNYFVVEENNIRILIDVGVPGTFAQLQANLKRYDIALEDIRYLLVTHYHPDHAGVAQEVKGKGPRLLVLEPQEDAIEYMKIYMKPAMNYIPITLDDNLHLSISESRSFLKKLGFDGEIITTPGHSDDSVSLVLDSGDAFIGDLTSPEMVDETNRDLVLSSWDKLRTLHATRFYTGHGMPQPLPF